MKTEKLNLNELKVESFITSLEENKSGTVKGGSTVVCASSLPCGTVVVATVTVTIVATIAGTVPIPDVPTQVPNGYNANNTQCCSYLQGCGQSYDPGCM